MSWIQKVSYDKAKGTLKKLYDRVKGPENNIDNILAAHSLRPHTLTGHMSLYKSVLHSSSNTLPKWYLEAIGVYVSCLNKCTYCVDHHLEGLKRLLNDEKESKSMIDSLNNGMPEKHFTGKYLQGIRYAKRLTCEAETIQEQDIEDLRLMGITDGEVLEINQVVSYFNYANRMVLGLGITTYGDTLGLSPNNSNDPESWNHQ